LAKILIIGAGPMGLAAAYQAALDGHQVEVVEAAPVAGGMAAHFDFDGLSIERFYHFICHSDTPTFELLAELGIADKLIWAPTTMGFFFQGKLNRWGDPLALLELPGASLLTKLRYGLFALVATKRRTWPALEKQSAKEWLTRWCGKTGYDIFWHPLLDFKFYEFAGNISAAWIWTRIRRVGQSRKSVMQEELGYLEGGSQTLVDALLAKMTELGCKVRLSAPVQRVTVENNRVTGADTPDGHIAADYVISTIPVQQIPRMIPDLPEDWRARYAAIQNVGICCVIFKLRRSISPYFWINISDPEIEIPGVIEFSILRKMDPAIVYVPYYMPTTNPKFSWTDEHMIEDALACITKLNPEISKLDVISARVSRLRHAQPVCDVGFAAKIPPVRTPIAGLQIADTCFYYPEDRGIAESVRLGRDMARAAPKSA
jgi:protoporphyrinogen oxidase